MTDERVQLTQDQALQRLKITPEYDPGGDEGPGDCVHTIRQSGPGGIFLIGAHHRLPDILEAIDKYGIEEAGPAATAHGHDLVIIDDLGPLFLETKQER